MEIPSADSDYESFFDLEAEKRTLHQLLRKQNEVLTGSPRILEAAKKLVPEGFSFGLCAARRLQRFEDEELDSSSAIDVLILVASYFTPRDRLVYIPIEVATRIITPAGTTLHPHNGFTEDDVRILEASIDDLLQAKYSNQIPHLNDEQLNVLEYPPEST